MKKLIKPLPPAGYQTIVHTINLYDGMSLKEILNWLPEGINESSVIFNVRYGYYDDIDYEMSYSVEEDLPKEEYEYQMEKYNKKLAKYERDLEKANKPKEE